jgi:molecular chaperone GrpE
MADENNRGGHNERQEPTLDLNSQSDRPQSERSQSDWQAADRGPDESGVEDMMSSLDTALGETFAEPPSEIEEELRAENASLKDQVLRAMAEVENVRRRLEREKQDATKFGVSSFAKAVLPVADNLERALQSAPEEARAANESLKNLCIGLEMTQNELKTALERNGIKMVDAMGKKLDPNLHQAMFEVEDPSVAAGTVVQVIQQGYTLHERLLRPAMVGVAKGGPKDGAKDAPAPAAANENPAASDAANAYAKTDQAGTNDKKLDTEL